MIDVTVVAIGAAASSALGAGFNLYQVKKNEEMKKQLKKQRTELLLIESCGGLALIASFVDAHLWKKRLKQVQSLAGSRIDQLEVEVADLKRRIESLNISAIDAKLDMVVAATTSKIIPTAETGKDKT